MPTEPFMVSKILHHGCEITHHSPPETLDHHRRRGQWRASVRARKPDIFNVRHDLEQHYPAAHRSLTAPLLRQEHLPIELQRFHPWLMNWSLRCFRSPDESTGCWAPSFRRGSIGPLLLPSGPHHSDARHHWGQGRNGILTQWAGATAHSGIRRTIAMDTDSPASVSPGIGGVANGFFQPS